MKLSVSFCKAHTYPGTHTGTWSDFPGERFFLLPFSTSHGGSTSHAVSRRRHRQACSKRERERNVNVRSSSLSLEGKKVLKSSLQHVMCVAAAAAHLFRFRRLVEKEREREREKGSKEHSSSSVAGAPSPLDLEQTRHSFSLSGVAVCTSITVLREMEKERLQPTQREKGRKESRGKNTQPDSAST